LVLDDLKRKKKVELCFLILVSIGCSMKVMMRISMSTNIRADLRIFEFKLMKYFQQDFDDEQET